MARSFFYRRLAVFISVAVLAGLATPSARSQQQQSGSIIGHLRLERGTNPPRRILVTVKTRGLTLQSSYADADGAFGFYSLPNNAYHVIVTDDEYDPVDVTALVDAPHVTIAFVNITLVVKDKDKKTEAAGLTGGNPVMVGLGHLDDRFPPAAARQFEKGVELEQKKKPAEAIKAYKKALELAPDFYPARNNLGSALMAKGEFAQAEEQFAQVIKLNQNDAAPYFNLGNIYLMTGRLEQAKSTVEDGLRKEPSTGLGHFLLGTIYQKLGKARDAETELKRSLVLNPALSNAHLALVNLYLQSQRSDLAAEELRGFLKEAPADPLAAKAREVLARLEAKQ